LRVHFGKIIFYIVNIEMPGRKKYGKRVRRAYRRRHRFSRATNGMPLKHYCELTYVEQFAIDAIADTTSVYTFRANSLYDPNVTSTGHQPMGFDEMCNYYNKFTVIGASIELMPVYGSAAQPNPSMWGCAITTEATSLSGQTTSHLLEQKLTSRMTYSGIISNENVNTNRIKKYFSLRKFFGGSVPSTDPSYQCTSSADAATLAFFQVYAVSTVPAENPGNMNFIARIKYKVVCTDPIVLGQS